MNDISSESNAFASDNSELYEGDVKIVHETS